MLMERISKVIANSGYASRRKADDLIQIIPIEEDGSQGDPMLYHGWTTGPNEDQAIWHVKKGVVWNNLYYTNDIWRIQDGNQNGEYSTNGTWLYAFEDTEIIDNMIFKSNKFNFRCKFSTDFK